MEINVNLNEARATLKAAKDAYHDAKVKIGDAIVEELKRNHKAMTVREIAREAKCPPCMVYDLLREYIDDRLSIEYKRNKRVFVEVDNQGKVIPDGSRKVITQVETVYRYR